MSVWEFMWMQAKAGLMWLLFMIPLYATLMVIWWAYKRAYRKKEEK